MYIVNNYAKPLGLKSTSGRPYSKKIVLNIDNSSIRQYTVKMHWCSMKSSLMIYSRNSKGLCFAPAFNLNYSKTAWKESVNNSSLCIYKK